MFGEICTVIAWTIPQSCTDILNIKSHLQFGLVEQNNPNWQMECFCEIVQQCVQTANVFLHFKPPSVSDPVSFLHVSKAAQDTERKWECSKWNLIDFKGWKLQSSKDVGDADLLVNIVRSVEKRSENILSWCKFPEKWAKHEN